MPFTELVLISEPPPPLSMCGMAYRQPYIVPLTFTFSVRSMTSSGTSWNTPGRFTPALLNTTWSPPQRSTVPSV
jgi:hypothetical protein